MAEYVNSTLRVEAVVRVDRGDGTAIEQRLALAPGPIQTAEGAAISVEVPLEFHLDDLLKPGDQVVPRSFVKQAGEIMAAILPAYRELETKYAAAMRALDQAPNLTMQLDAATIEALADALRPTVNVAPAEVNIVNQIEQPPREIVVKRDPRTGLIESAKVEDA